MKVGDVFGPHNVGACTGDLLVEDVVRPGLYMVACEKCGAVLGAADKGAVPPREEPQGEDLF